MTSITSIPKWNTIFYSNDKTEIIDTINILNDCVCWIFNEVEHPTFDHSSMDDVYNGHWDRGISNLRSWLRIAGKLINRHCGYDYIAEHFPAVVATAPWDSGLNDSDYRMSYYSLDKKTLKVVKSTY